MWLTAALSLGKVHCFFISPQYLPNCVRCCWSQQLVILSQTVLILWIDLCDTFSHRWSFSERMITLDVLLQHLLTVVPSCSFLCSVLYFALRGDNKTSSTWSFSSLYSASRLPDNLLAMIREWWRVVEAAALFIYSPSPYSWDTCLLLSFILFFLSQSAPKTCFLSSTTITKKVTIFLTLLLLLPLVCKVVAAAVNNSKTV